jgi:hypothetical protein
MRVGWLAVLRNWLAHADPFLNAEAQGFVKRCHSFIALHDLKVDLHRAFGDQRMLRMRNELRTNALPVMGRRNGY